MLRTWTFGEVTVTVETPDALIPDVSLWFHRTRHHHHDDVIAAVGGVTALDPIDPTNGSNVEIRRRAKDGSSCDVLIALGDSRPKVRYPVATALRELQDELARQTDDSAADEAGNQWSFTKQFTRMTRALALAADETPLEPFAIRLLVAIDDRAGAATTQQLIDDLAIEGSNVRRALGPLYSLGLAVGEGLGGGRRRPGVMTLVRLTPKGEAVTARVHELASASRRNQPQGDRDA